MDPINELHRHLTRRQLLANSLRPLGAAALASLVGGSAAQPAAAEPSSLPPVAAARAPIPEPQQRDETPPPVKISDDFAVIERNPIPPLLVTQTIWHPRAERRVALIERLDDSEGGEALRLHEGDRIGSLQLVSIEPAGVVFVHDGVELRRRVGARP